MSAKKICFSKQDTQNNKEEETVDFRCFHKKKLGWGLVKNLYSEHKVKLQRRI